MSLQPIPGFRHFPTHHCITGSLRHIYEFNGYPISEEMLLGLGAGVGFVYWHTRDSLPFLGGRANLERPGEEGLEKAAGRRTGVLVQSYRTGSAARAEKRLLELLGAGQPVILRVDMGFLPYLDFGGEEYHFGYHMVVACALEREGQLALLADRDAELHPVPLADLRRARGSTCPPFPPGHSWYEFDFSRPHPILAGDLWEAMRASAAGMLAPPITNLGVKGIRKAAARIRKWPDEMGERQLREACINACILIDARGGTGGGLFRYMYARFLQEAAEICKAPALVEVGKEIQAAGDGWQQAAGLFEEAYTAGQPAAKLEAASQLLPGLAAQEERAWRRLAELAQENS